MSSKSVSCWINRGVMLSLEIQKSEASKVKLVISISKLYMCDMLESTTHTITGRKRLRKLTAKEYMEEVNEDDTNDDSLKDQHLHEADKMEQPQKD